MLETSAQTACSSGAGLISTRLIAVVIRDSRVAHSQWWIPWNDHVGPMCSKHCVAHFPCRLLPGEVQRVHTGHMLQRVSWLLHTLGVSDHLALHDLAFW